MEVSAILIVDNASSDSTSKDDVYEGLIPASLISSCNDSGRLERSPLKIS